MSANPEDDRSAISRLLLAGLGAASSGAEAIDGFADDVARRLGVDRDEVRTALRDTVASWRGEADKLGGRRSEALDRVLESLGVVRRAELEDVQLRVAQLEHRLRLLERTEPQSRA